MWRGSLLVHWEFLGNYSRFGDHDEAKGVQVSGLMMKLLQRLAALRITIKISLAFGLLLLTLLLETSIEYAALTVVLESNEAILANTEMQRLAMSMSRNWETVNRLQYSFFFQSATIGIDQVFDLYALPAGGKITEVICDGAALKRLIASSQASSDLLARSPISINTFRPSASTRPLLKK